MSDEEQTGLVYTVQGVERLEAEIDRLRAENRRTRSLLRWDIAEDDEGIILCDGDQERRFYSMSIVDALRAENEKLRAALKPFADQAEYIGNGWSDDDKVGIGCFVGDLRAVKEANGKING